MQDVIDGESLPYFYFLNKNVRTLSVSGTGVAFLIAGMFQSLLTQVLVVMVRAKNIYCGDVGELMRGTQQSLANFLKSVLVSHPFSGRLNLINMYQNNVILTNNYK